MSDFERIDKHVYPAYLTLNKETVGGKVNYLDMTIRYSDRDQRWHSKLYDKRMDLVAKEFAHPDSCLVQQCEYGVITSQLSRFRVANTGSLDCKQRGTVQGR
eukprot:TRINITY_DN8951_c0_g3_i1.p1 TRINITY_DN8951_c0_g3~~TRINITY_DN8951_c0_g3_i1.p1  ORF type:complete len:102 (-),score=6.54 TRINITY_DN8951_c0_g3_i1:154-459(-)